MNKYQKIKLFRVNKNDIRSIASSRGSHLPHNDAASKHCFFNRENIDSEAAYPAEHDEENGSPELGAAYPNGEQPPPPFQLPPQIE